ncbi:hypothetical protein [Chitinolyticbacter meiyuanensis]|uniref:hypothetical protein n=1 Tax=Chitinolyticbacter meiyuanensis TaxID=682798 RepID=UPI0011E5A3CE|nr:hypothetical protein [Chitinolyticbacter meiyuanensis]
MLFEFAIQLSQIASLLMLVAAGVLWHRTRTLATLTFFLALLAQKAGLLLLWAMPEAIAEPGTMLIRTWWLAISGGVACAGLLAYALSLPKRQP